MALVRCAKDFHSSDDALPISACMCICRHNAGSGKCCVCVCGTLVFMPCLPFVVQNCVGSGFA